MGDIRMAKGAYTVVRKCANVQSGEEVVIVTEDGKRSIANALASMVVASGAEPVIMTMLPRKRDGEEPPETVAAAMYKSNVFLCVVSKSITHTHAVRNATKNSSRGLVLTHFTEEMMYSGGIEADFPSVAPVCQGVANALAGAERIHLTTLHGTDLHFSAKGRRGNALFGVVKPGEFSTIPTIEANVSPLEGTANGVLVANASVPYLGIGILREPVVCKVKDGIIISVEGGEQAHILKRDLDAKGDPMVYNVAEMGIGLNPKCHFCGFMLEDEGVYGSVHIGIGTSITLGGSVKTACHYDLIMTDAEVVADGKTILSDGRIHVENIVL